MIRKSFVTFVIALVTAAVLPCRAEAAEETKVHFISLASTTDAILLESNGHFGMVDSGEDWDYPDSEDYPLRYGVTTGIGYEQQVIHYLRQLGVEKLDFYIATHSHSDHIGSGDEILDAFPTERLYINRYDDSYMTDAHGNDPSDPYYNEDANESRLWDNQYVYDQIIEAANRNGTQIITDLDLEENVQYRSFTLGDMSIQLLNLERRKDENGIVIPVADENDNCIVTKISAYGKNVLLTSDLDPTEGDTAQVANQLIEEIGTSDESKVEESRAELKKSYQIDNYAAMSEVELDLPENRTLKIEEEQVSEGIDESKKNTGKTISLDLMKMSHHSIDYNNTTYFLTSLNPKTVVVTGYESWFNARERDCLPNAALYATATDSAAVIATIQEDGIQTEYKRLRSEWYEIDGDWYYFDKNGRTYTDSSAHQIDGKIYCFNAKGALETENRWVLVEGKWKYWLTEGEYLKGNWLEEGKNWYYLDAKGNAVTGWKQINGNWYYFNENTTLAIDVWIGDYYVDELGIWDPTARKDQWILSGSRWWYRHADGSYTCSGWEQIDGNWYYFDVSGWMVTGWQWIGGKCYYFAGNGAMASDTWIGNDYVDESGVWVPGVTKDQWILSGNRWWYRHADGSYTRSGWEVIGGSWYYFDVSGWMVTGWQWISGKCYYFSGSGAMVSDAWIGDYYVDGSGVWVQNAARDQWILSGNRWWYRHADGSYTISDWEKIGEKSYYFDASGWMMTGWQLIDKDWYYFYGSGEMASGVWIGDYYLKSNGKMAVSEWIENGKYYVDGTGCWVRI